jgi:hypothetical protein
MVRAEDVLPLLITVVFIFCVTSQSCKGYALIAMILSQVNTEYDNVFFSFDTLFVCCLLSNGKDASFF